MDSVGQRRMAPLHGGRRDKLEISPNLWAGVGLVRGGAGTALVGDPRDGGGAHRGIRRRSASTPSSCRATRTWKRPTASPSWCSRCCRSRTCTNVPAPTRVNTGPFGETIANDHRRSAGRPRSHERRRQSRLPVPSVLTQWALPLGIIVVWQASSVAGSIPGRGAAGADRCAGAGWKLLQSGELAPQHLGELLARASSASPSAAASASRSGWPTGCRSVSERVSRFARCRWCATSPHLALIPLVILWFGIDEDGQAVPGRARRVLPDLHQHPARHPHRRPAAGRDGPHLRHVAGDAVLAGDPARRAAVDLRRPALCARHHVADPDRGRDHLGLIRHRLHGDAGARVPAGRRRAC